MQVLPWIAGVTFISLLVSLAGAGLVLVTPAAIRRRVLPFLVAYATGTLLAAALLGMLPTALRLRDAQPVLRVVLGGIVVFFALEKALIWRHCHHPDCRTGHGRAAALILMGDAVHNFVDGLVIGGAFLAGVEIGLATSLAVVAHEIPQELGDFAILLESGDSPARALLWNLLSGLPIVAGGLVAWRLLGSVQGGVAYALAFAAASFIYVAAADLIPELHRRQEWKSSLTQLVLLLSGIATIVAVPAVSDH